MSTLINNLTNSLIRIGIVTDDDKDLYIFGLEQGLFITLNFCTTIIVGLLFRMIWESILFSVVYMSLRINAGGYHAKTPLRCYIFSTAMIAVVLSVINLAKQSQLICVIMATVGAIVIFLCAPVEDAHKPLDENEQKVYRHRARLTLLFWAVVFLFSLVLSLKNMLTTISVAVATLAIIVVYGSFVNRRNDVVKGKS